MTIQLSAISKTFATQPVFEGVSLFVGSKSRMGLIGRNGCGKSTLLKIMMRLDTPSEGTISFAPGLHVNYLSQEPRINPALTLEAEMRTVFTQLNALQAEEEQVLTQMQAAGQSEESHMKLAHRLDTIHRGLERLDAGTADARIGRILKGLGFSLPDYQRRTGEFSGGWQMRINLAKVLLEGADILLLDEPTNHLDLEACEWLEGFLKDYPGGLVVVSHDRRFLDKVTTEIAEMELGRLTLWPGNYTAHLVQKAEAREQLVAAHDRQSKEIAKQSAFVERFRASATRSTQAKSREKQLEKIERIEIHKEDKRRMAFRFPSPKASGRQVITLRGVAKSFGEKHLFRNLTADLQRNQRIFILGANGVGKTTLLRLILGQEPLDAGEIRLGHQAEVGYFSQNQLDTLSADLTVFDTVQEACPKLNNTEVRSLLGRFLFTGDQVFKPVSVLSGGEKSKLALAKLMLTAPNTLLLDEPTNHMDIPAKEVITEALQEYEGSFLCISHDRYFIQELATDIWEIADGQLYTYCGDYDYYLFKRDEMHAAGRALALQVAKPEPVVAEQAVQHSLEKPAIEKPVERNEEKPAGNHYQLKKDQERTFRQVEKQILALESALGLLAEQLNDPGLQQDYQQLQSLSDEVGAKQTQLAKLYDTWSELAETMG